MSLTSVQTLERGCTLLLDVKELNVLTKGALHLSGDALPALREPGLCILIVDWYAFAL